MQSANFWIIANALRDFYLTDGVLPLPGALPDMKAQSVDYIELQNIYKAKARNDLARVVEKVRLLERTLHRNSPVDEKEIEAFCKGAAFIKLIKGQLLRPALPANSEERRQRARSFCSKLQNEDSLLRIHAAFIFYDFVMGDLMRQNAETPSTQAELHASLKEHLSTETERVRRLRDLWGAVEGFDVELCDQKIEDSLAELVRAKGGELHNVSALTGGMVAQEVIKVITKQYIPIDNTCVFDGIVSKTEVFRSLADLVP